MPLLQNCINTPNPGMMHAKRLTCSPFIDSFDSLKVSWITAFAAADYDMMKNCSYSCCVNDSDTIDILCDSLAELIDINENEEDNIDLRQILENLIILTDDGD